MLNWHEVLLSLKLSISWEFSAFPGLFKVIVLEARLKISLTVDLISDFAKIFEICELLLEINKYSLPRLFSTLFFCIERPIFPNRLIYMMNAISEV
jgi:hypothetical protein